MLLEALICVLIMSIIGAGTAYLTARMNVSAKNVRVNGAAVAQMRVLLQQYGSTLCDGATNSGQASVMLPKSFVTQQLQVHCSTGGGRSRWAACQWRGQPM